MPRTFEVSVSSPTTVSQVHAAFGSETYWYDRFVALGVSTDLSELDIADDGAVTVKTVQDLRRDGLPSLVARFYRRDLLVYSTERWTPDGAGNVNGAVDIDVAGAPGSGRGRAVLEPDGTGSQLSFTGMIEFKVPLVGGRVEGYLGDQFSEHIPEIQRFTTAWIQSR